MNKVDFSKISAIYEDHSIIQKSAAEILLNILEIRDNDDILDLGCGVGNHTMKLREITEGKVVGIDPSEGMIKEAKEKSKGFDIIFEVKSAEDMDYYECFDVIFCNSSFQWFRNPEKAAKNCYTALKKDGKIGIQAPAKKTYSPNFIKAVEKVRADPRTKDIFSHFRPPWFFLETSDEYKNFFEKIGFKVIFSKIECLKTKHTPNEVFNIFSSGAIIGYLGQDFYETKIDDDYIETFKKIVKEEFDRQAKNQGEVELIFNNLLGCVKRIEQIRTNLINGI